MQIVQSPSPNFSRTTHKKIGVQIHKTLGLMPYTLGWLRNPKAYASCHYLITRKGEIHQLVQQDKRAWSAGRISNPSVRAKKIMKKNIWGSYIKPGHYLIQIEFECLSNQTFTDLQYSAATWLIETSFDFKITEENFLEHRDTAIYKPDLDKERSEILKRLKPKKAPESFVIKEGENALICVDGGKIIIEKIK